MKSILSIAIVMGALSLYGCKDDENSKPSENSVTSFLTEENGFVMDNRSSGPWELGVVFSASVAGKMTELGTKMPDPGAYRIIVWDFDTKQIVRQKTVEQTAPDLLTLSGIEALELPANKKFVISINSQSAGTNKRYGVAYKDDYGDFMPYTKGSILVHNSCYSSVATPTFPTGAQNVKSEIYGFPEFTFIPD